MWPNPQETADLVTFTKEILIGKLYFFVQCQCHSCSPTINVTLVWRLFNTNFQNSKQVDTQPKLILHNTFIWHTEKSYERLTYVHFRSCPLGMCDCFPVKAEKINSFVPNPIKTKDLGIKFFTSLCNTSQMLQKRKLGKNVEAATRGVL